MKEMNIKTGYKGKSVKFIANFLFVLSGFLGIASLLGGVPALIGVRHTSQDLINNDPIFHQKWMMLIFFTLSSLIIAISILILTRQFLKRKNWARITLVFLLIVSIVENVIMSVFQNGSMLSKMLTGAVELSLDNFSERVFYMQGFASILGTLVVCGAIVYLIVQLLSKRMKQEFISI